MSRHRDVRNLTEDDYYDDDDYYDEDDYYEDDDAYYQEQERIRKAKEAEAKKKKAAAQAKAKVANVVPKPKVTKGPAGGTGGAKSNTNKNANIGISLGGTNNKNTKNNNTGGGGQKKGGDGANNTKGGISGVMKPPPGFGRPTPPLAQSPASTTTTATKDTTTAKNNTSTDTRKENANKKKQISPVLQKRLEASKSRLSLVILGHVDAGKSTLMGQVLVQLGLIQKRLVTKYQKEAAEIGKASFFLAWVMDEDQSERERGVTIDIATKNISTPKHDLTILDAPGHADYVPAMITGAASADVGLLVVAATPGEFESGFDNGSDNIYKNGGSGRRQQHCGQTREHVILSRGLGVSQLIVAVNKLDGAEPAWSQQRFLEIQQRLLPFLQTNGFDKKKVTFIPISGLNGVNINKSPSKDDAPELAKWYKGMTLLEAIDNFEPARRNIDKPLRFIITDMYSEGKGISVRGRVVQGMMSVGDRVVVLPLGDKATVSRIEHSIVSTSTITPSASLSSKEDFDAERSKIAVAGDSVDLYILGVDVARINPGNIISDLDIQLRPRVQKKMRAKILVMDQLTVPIIRGAQVLLHMHSLDIPAQINSIVSKTNKKDGSLIPKPRVLTAGSQAVVEIKLSAKVCIEAYNKCQALGRFVLRRGGDTIAVGIVEEVLGH